MNKLFGLFLLALAFLAPQGADAACSGGSCFWIGGAGTINGTLDNGHWALISGGGSCSCVPATTDTVAFDASSGGGTVVVNMGGSWTVANLALTGFTGTLDFATNNDNFNTPASVNDADSGGTLNMGSGTWTLSGGSSLFSVNGTLNAGTSTLSFTATSPANGSFRRLFGNGKTFNIVSIAANANGAFSFANSGTITTLTAGAPNRFAIGGGSTVTITNAMTFTGSSGNEIAIMGDGVIGGGTQGTFSSANNVTCTWCAIGYIVFSGGGTFTATNSFDLGGNTNVSITAPSSGGGGGGRIIGG